MSSVNFLEKLLGGVSVEWMPISDFSSVLRGKRLTKSQLSEGADVPVYHGGLDPLGMVFKTLPLALSEVRRRA